MILNSRKRHQLRQQQRQGKTIVASVRKGMIDGGIDEQTANTQLGHFIALGSTKGSWWADIGFMRRLKAQMRRQVSSNKAEEYLDE